MVFHWWNAYHYEHLEYFLRLQAARGCILLVHWYDWYDWYQWNIILSNGIPLVKCISLRELRIFSTVSGCEGVHSTCPLVRLLPMEYHSFQWYSIGEMHIITGTLNISFSFRLRGGAFYLSIGTIGTIGTNGISFIPLVFYWWNAYHYGDLEYFLRLQAARSCILLVHWYDWYHWYQWNITHSNGIPLVKCISLRGL